MVKKHPSRHKRIPISKEIFNPDQYSRLLGQLARSTAKASNTLLSYDYFTNRFSHIVSISNDDLLYAIHVAYSWMPTMINLLHISDIRELDALIPSINCLREIKTHEQLSAEETNVLHHLSALSRVINNSVVGTSKILHFFSPQTIPIIDSRVVVAWNSFFKRHPAVALSGCHPVIGPIKYLNYWKALLFWKEQAGLSSIRQLENPFFILGGTGRQGIG